MSFSLPHLLHESFFISPGAHALLFADLEASFAGADTTAIAINSIIYHLTRTPTAYSRLTAEIDFAVHSGRLTVPAAYADAIQLPYLKACVNEGMRLHPSVGFTMPRTVPAGGALISGVHLPAGSRIGINPAVVHHDTAVFGLDADIFNPDRWLGEKEAVSAMEKNLLTFGAGSRTCIGENVSPPLPFLLPMLPPKQF